MKLTVHNGRYVSSVFDGHVKEDLTAPGKKTETQSNINKWHKMVQETFKDTYSYNMVVELREQI